MTPKQVAPFLALMALPGCADETVSGYVDRRAVYVLEEIGGAPFPARATIGFPEPGRLSGEAPCNRWSGAQAAPYPWFEPGPIAATRRACPMMDAEVAFFAALEAMTLAEVAGEVLILSNGAGQEMVFRAE